MKHMEHIPTTGIIRPEDIYYETKNDCNHIRIIIQHYI